MSRIDIGLGRHGPFHSVSLEGKPDDPVLRLEGPGIPVLCLTAEGAGKLADAIIGALERAGLRNPAAPPTAGDIAGALLSGTLGVTANGEAVPGK